MNIVASAIPDVKIIEPRVLADERGFFMATWNERDFAALMPGLRFVQDNHSRSAKGVLRGLHYQVVQPQGKLVRVTARAIFDVAVDLRRSSRDFGRAVGVELSSGNRRMTWIPPGFAHGFLCLEEDTDVVYKCTDFYAPEHERVLLWNDPKLDIAWPLGDSAAPMLSSRDVAGLPLIHAETFF